MITKAPTLTSTPFISIAALAACAVLSGPVPAKGHEVTVTVPVSTAGLDLRDPGSVRELYRRLRLAARTACDNGNRVDLLQPLPNFAGCYEKALGNAVRSVDRPQLNAVYLETHTLRDAATYGIEVPVRMAAE